MGETGRHIDTPVRPGSWTPALASLLVYSILTVIIGREVLANLSTSVANDAGDPLLTAALLHWNAHHLPWTEAWWQLPIFYPTRDALAFSEHLLGLSVVVAPIDWITGDPLVTYNITSLLTFPLSALTMFLLVRYLTGSSAGAFIAGLAFGFAPFRISQLPHIQMLAAFWAPLALLGLHAFLDTGKRRWLGLYGLTWMLQAAANGYALVFFSVLVGLWALWFVVAQRRWRDLGMIAGATMLAAVPLVPILYTYVTVHRLHGFTRGIDEIRGLSADVAALLCAPPGLTFWGWVRVACRAEGELFPGPGLFALCAAALVGVLRSRQGAPAWLVSTWVTRLRHLLMAVAAIYAVVIAAALIVGPWRIDWAFVHVSVASLRKPMLIGATALLLALVLSPGVLAAARRSSVSGFYLLGALVTWLLALGPTVTLMGVPTGYSGPFAWLLALPGADGLRVPARFWLMTVICLSVAAGVFVAECLARRSRVVSAVLVTLLGGAVLADGWPNRIGVQAAPPPVPDATKLVGQTVMELPVAQYSDIAAQWRAIVGGWKSVNGFSGFGPSYYATLSSAVAFGEDALFQPFQQNAELHVIVPKGAPRLQALVERQPGSTKTAENDWALQYRLPPRRMAVSQPPGPRLPIVSLRSACAGDSLPLALDNDLTTRMVCSPSGDAPEVHVDLGRVASVGSFVQGLGPYWWDAPRHLVVETSVDGATWSEAWNQSILGATIAAAMRDPASLRIVLSFAPREARFLRARPEHQEPDYTWTIAEVEVLAPPEPGQASAAPQR